MSRTNGVFTAAERRVALWVLLLVAAVAAFGFVIQEWGRPSLGPGGAEAYISAPLPGVLDAQPIG